MPLYECVNVCVCVCVRVCVCVHACDHQLSLLLSLSHTHSPPCKYAYMQIHTLTPRMCMPMCACTYTHAHTQNTHNSHLHTFDVIGGSHTPSHWRLFPHFHSELVRMSGQTVRCGRSCCPCPHNQHSASPRHVCLSQVLVLHLTATSVTERLSQLIS